jgi:hypothetical protein
MSMKVIRPLEDEDDPVFARDAGREAVGTIPLEAVSLQAWCMRVLGYGHNGGFHGSGEFRMPRVEDL